MKRITPIQIISPGDPSVGIWGDEWQILGNIDMGEDEIEIFRENLRAAFEYVSDDCIVIFNCDNNVGNHENRS